MRFIIIIVFSEQFIEIYMYIMTICIEYSSIDSHILLNKQYVITHPDVVEIYILHQRFTLYCKVYRTISNLQIAAVNYLKRVPIPIQIFKQKRVPIPILLESHPIIYIRKTDYKLQSTLLHQRFICC